MQTFGEYNRSVNEVAYDGNMGFHEMMLFYRHASEQEKKRMEKLISNEKFRKAWEFLQKVVGVDLKD